MSTFSSINDDQYIHCHHNNKDHHMNEDHHGLFNQLSRADQSRFAKQSKGEPLLSTFTSYNHHLRIIITIFQYHHSCSAVLVCQTITKILIILTIIKCHYHQILSITSPARQSWLARQSAQREPSLHRFRPPRKSG